MNLLNMQDYILMETCLMYLALSGSLANTCSKLSSVEAARTLSKIKVVDKAISIRTICFLYINLSFIKWLLTHWQIYVKNFKHYTSDHHKYHVLIIETCDLTK